MECFSLESIRVGENVEMVAEGAVPESTLLILPDNTRKLQGWLYDFIYKRFEFMLQDSKNIGLAGYAIYHLADDLLKDKVTPDDNKAFYWYLKGHILADSVYAECNLAEAAACFRQALEKGGLLQLIGSVYCIIGPGIIGMLMIFMFGLPMRKFWRLITSWLICMQKVSM